MALLDWKSLKDKVKQVSDNVVEFAKDASDNVAEFAKETSDNVAEVWNSEEAIKFREGVVEKIDKVKATSSDITQKTTEFWNSEEVMHIREEVASFVDSVKESDVVQKTNDFWNSEKVTQCKEVSQKTLKVISGIQAVEDRRKSIETREEADLLKAEIETTNEAIREDLNEILEAFGKYKLESLKDTVGRFLHCLEQMNQRAKGKEYEFLTEIDIRTEEIKEMESIDMGASDALRSLAVGGGFATVGLMGTPVAVTAAVTAVASASTGTAISALSGAAAHNAVLAWLGGGAISAGGGGMAAGTVVLGAITATATVGLAVVAVGTLASRFYSKKNTEAEAYLAEVKLWAEQMQANWVVLAGVKKRINELYEVTIDLAERCKCELDKLERIIPVFDNSNSEHVRCFQQCALMAKSVSELAITPVLDEEGNISQQAGVMVAKTQKILNSEL